MPCPARAEPPEYAEYASGLRATCASLADEVAGYTGIGQVLDWMRRKGLDLRTIELISQDEFEYDFLLELDPGGRWLAFGVT